VFTSPGQLATYYRKPICRTDTCLAGRCFSYYRCVKLDYVISRNSITEHLHSSRKWHSDWSAEVVRGFVSHVPTSVSLYAVAAYEFFKAAEGGNRHFDAAKLFLISKKQTVRTPHTEIIENPLGVLFDPHSPYQPSHLLRVT
jgi:hypothetical protein